MNIVKAAKVVFLVIFYIKIMNFFLKFICLDQPQNFTKPNPTTVMIFLAIIFFMFHTNNPASKEHSNPSSSFDDLSGFIISEISSIPLLDPSPNYLNNIIVPILSALCDHHVDENILIEGSNMLDESGDAFSPPLPLLDYKNKHTEDEAARIQQEKCPVENELIISFGALHDEIGYDNGENGFSPLRDCQKSITIYDHGDINGAEMDEYSNYDTWQCGYEGDSEDNGYSKHDGLNQIFEEFIAANKRVWREDLIKEKSLCLEG